MKNIRILGIAIFIILGFWMNLHAQCNLTVSISPNVSICSGASTTLSATPSNGTPPYSYAWTSNPPGTTGNSPSIVVSPLTLTTYFITVTDNSTPTPCSASGQVVVTVNPLPVPDFSFTPNNQCSPMNVQFANLSSGQLPLVYSWAFGDGNTSFEVNPLHSYIIATLGGGQQTFIASLVVTDVNGCFSSIAKTITVKKNPDATLKRISGGAPSDPPFINCEATPSPFNLTVGYYPPSGYSLSDNASYYIDWGDGHDTGTFPTFPSPPGIIHTYSTFDQFVITFTVTAVNGCTQTNTFIAYNGSNPSIGLGNPGNTTGCLPLTIGFPITSWQSNTPGTRYRFKYGDNSPDTIMYAPLPDTLRHTYNTSSCGQPLNSFKALIAAINLCDSTGMETGSIKISKKPTAVISTSGTVFCVNTNITFSNQSIAGCYVENGTARTGTNFTWNFGDGSALINTYNVNTPFPSISHSFSAAGTYIVTLSATNYSVGGTNCGNSVDSLTICISPQPISTFTVNKATDCVPFTVIATNTSPTPNTCNDRIFTWSVTQDGSPSCTPSNQNYTLTVIGNNASVNFQDPGNYTVKLNVKNTCSAAGVNSTQAIIAKTIPRVNINTIPDICQGGAITPTATFQTCYDPIIGYLWTFTGGSPSSSTLSSPGSITYSTTGSYNVKVKANNICGWSTEAISNTFLVKPLPVITALPSTQSICAGTSSAAITLSSTLTGTTYSWTTNSTAGITGALANGTANPIPAWILNNSTTSPGTVTITIIPTAVGCAGAPLVYTITVNPSPAANAGANRAICIGGSTQLGAAPVSGNTYSWVSNPVGYTSTLSNPTVSPIVTTTYTLTETITATGCSKSNSVIVTVDPLPAANAGALSLIHISEPTRPY